MTDEPDNLVLRHLRRIETKLDVLADVVRDIGQRLTSLERHIGETQIQLATVNARIDDVNTRLDRIERRLELAEA